MHLSKCSFSLASLNLLGSWHSLASSRDLTRFHAVCLPTIPPWLLLYKLPKLGHIASALLILLAPCTGLLSDVNGYWLCAGATVLMTALLKIAKLLLHLCM